jgi:plastocyanin
MILLLALLVAAASGSHEVTMPGQAYAPGRVYALVGDTVTWRNTDHLVHTVTADDDAFDSGDLDGGATFARTFAAPGEYRFHCRIHRFMRGVVVVSQVVLRGPDRPVPAGARATLRGVAPAGGAEVVLRRGAETVGRTTAGSDGSFSFELVPVPGSRYRALAGSAASAELAIAVVPRVTLTRSAGTLRVATSPPLPGAYVRIEVHSRERYAWHRFRTARLGPDGTVALEAAPRRRVLLRARVLALRGYADGVSAPLVAGVDGPARGDHGH